MVVAKSERAYTVLKRAFKERTVDKTYHALVQGHPDPSRGTIDAPVGRHPVHDYRWAVVAEGKDSVTHYETLEAFAAASLLEIHLETGRTHQIRVHFSALRHPCVGDLTYGADPTLLGPAGPAAAVAARRPARVHTSRSPGSRSPSRAPTQPIWHMPWTSSGATLHSRRLESGAPDERRTQPHPVRRGARRRCPARPRLVGLGADTGRSPPARASRRSPKELGEDLPARPDAGRPGHRRAGGSGRARPGGHGVRAVLRLRHRRHAARGPRRGLADQHLGPERRHALGDAGGQRAGGGGRAVAARAARTAARTAASAGSPAPPWRTSRPRGRAVPRAGAGRLERRGRTDCRARRGCGCWSARSVHSSVEVALRISAWGRRSSCRPTSRAGCGPPRSRPRSAGPGRAADRVLQAGNVHSGAFDEFSTRCRSPTTQGPGCMSTAPSACGRRPARACAR